LNVQKGKIKYTSGDVMACAIILQSMKKLGCGCKEPNEILT